MQALLLVLILSVVGESIQTEGQKLCGRNLAITLAALCREKELGHLEKTQKRSRGYNAISYYEPYWLAAETALQLSRGKRDGIVEECCNKACNVDELLEYCPPHYNAILYYKTYWLAPETALELSRGIRDGIVEECCNQACNMEELLGYCPQ